MSGLQFDLVVLDLDQGGPPQDFEQHGHAFAGHVLHNAFEAAERAVLEKHGLASLEAADFEQTGLVAQLFKFADALQQLVLQGGRLKAKAHQVVDALGAAHHRDALPGMAGPEKDVARKHGLEHLDRALRCFFVLLVQRQIGLEVLLLQVVERDLFKTGFGAGQVPGAAGRAVVFGHGGHQ